MKKLLHGLRAILLWRTLRADHGLRIILLTAFCLLFTINSFADVKIQGNPTVYPTIQAAVNAAINGDKLLVSTGLYLESVSITNKFIELEGGYISPMFSSRTNDFSSTIIGTNIVGAVVNINLSGGASLDTFTITGGNLWGLINGGGVLIDYDCICTMKNCQVYGNYAYFGGGISAWSNSTLFVDDCIIFDNESLFGGGGIAGYVDSKITLTNKTECIHNFSSVGGGIAASSKNLTINGAANVINNTAISKGGGIYLENCGLCNIFGEDTSIGSPFVVNRVTNGCGGGIYALNSSVIISGKNCRVNGALASDSGGGIYLTNSSLRLLDEAELGYAFSPSINSAGTNGGCLWMGNSEFTASGGAKVLMGHAGIAGGGMYITDSTATFINAFIEGNSASNGGGVYCDMEGMISGCMISSNSAIHGGGIYCYKGSSVSDCSISGNHANDSGGGSYCGRGSSLSNCTISGNSVKWWNGGGVYIIDNGSIFDCAISSNSSFDGGGVCIIGSGVVSRCTISGNNARYGGGVYCYYGGSVSDCSISGNSESISGGGVYCNHGGLVFNCMISSNNASLGGGGVYCHEGGSVSSCTISSNSSDYGGGIYCDQDGSLTNCLISGMNSADYGGGIYCSSGGALYNCTIANNSASAYGGGIICSNGGTVVNTIIYNNQALVGDLNWKSYHSGALFSYCCTTPTNNLPGGNQCIPDNPMFSVPGSDYALLDGSPCIDAGYKMNWMDPPATDLAGNPRLHDGHVDIGCYEFVPEPGAFGAVISYLLLVLGIYRKFDFIKNQI
ncbi:MAG: hypothetical protein DRI44_07535 [Chlamydiae bacterium]|nr:MAG: hypothetical protein DRI44_07535 [Chlamydiota bacterium]